MSISTTRWRMWGLRWGRRLISAGRQERHYARGVLHDADGRDAGGGGGGLERRAAFAVDTKVKTRLVGDLQTELVTDFFEGFARGARANVHVKTMYGRSNHHKIEAIFKAFARALRVACSRDKQLGEMLPSTKGTALMRVTVIDYKAGNLTSVLKALRHLGAEPEVTDSDWRWWKRRSGLCCRAWDILRQRRGGCDGADGRDSRWRLGGECRS